MKRIGDFTLKEIIDICNNKDGCCECPMGVYTEENDNFVMWRRQGNSCILKFLHHAMNVCNGELVEKILNTVIIKEDI